MSGLLNPTGQGSPISFLVTYILFALIMVECGFRVQEEVVILVLEKNFLMIMMSKVFRVLLYLTFIFLLFTSKLSVSK